MAEKVIYQAPTFPQWKETHQRQAIEIYKAKKETRQTYHWVVLSYLKYDTELIGVEQPTWFGENGATALGKILSTWISHGRRCFLVQAWNRRRTDIYLVVFEQDGRFVTLYSKTRDDIPNAIFPISRRNATLLLRLSLAVGDEQPRRITEHALLACVARKEFRNMQRHLELLKTRAIAAGIEIGVIEERATELFFTADHKVTEATIENLNPFGWEDFAWRQHVDPYV